MPDETETLTETPRRTVELIYREQGARLWRAVLFYAGDREVASDAVSEAFAQLLRRGDEVRDPSAWVWRTAFGLAGRELKRRKITTVAERGGETDDMPSALSEVLPLLTRQQRACVVLHYYAGYSQIEIARILGTTSSTVGVHLHRARKRLRELLEEDHED